MRGQEYSLYTYMVLAAHARHFHGLPRTGAAEEPHQYTGGCNDPKDHQNQQNWEKNGAQYDATWDEQQVGRTAQGTRTLRHKVEKGFYKVQI